MKLLEERILKDGHILGDNILKVDSFLTHQVDFSLMREIGKVFAEKFAAAGITKVVTIEASGIAPAVFTAEALNVPMIFAKKQKHHYERRYLNCRSLLLYQAGNKYRFYRRKIPLTRGQGFDYRRFPC